MLLVLTWLRAGEYFIGSGSVALYLLTIIPHEILHALCYKGDVYLYQNLGRGMVFVSGAERMSKGTKTPWHTTTKKIPSGISPGTGSILRVHSKWTTNPVPGVHLQNGPLTPSPWTIIGSSGFRSVRRTCRFRRCYRRLDRCRGCLFEGAVRVLR